MINPRFIHLKTMLRYVFISFFLILFYCARAQSTATASIKFDSLEHDFGQVKLNTYVEYEFWYKNTSQVPLKLLKVTASCGCTTPIWSEEPLAPGKRSSIKIRFQCFPIASAFSKTIIVESNTEPALSFLEIKGKCVDKDKTLLETYTMKSGKLLFENNHAAFDKIYTNETNKQRFLNFYNNSKDTVWITGFKSPEYISCEATPNIIAPGQTGSVFIRYDGTRNKKYGEQFDQVYMHTNDAEAPDKIIFVSSQVMEYFDTSSSANAVIYLKEKNYEFGKVKVGDVKKHSFTIQNKGTDTLIIREVKPSCGCTVVKLGSSIIPPGKSTKLDVEYNTLGAVKGVNNRPINIISTDRKNPSVYIGVSVIIE
jgi:hypothetical protein